jgi:hypothetical protein
LRIAELVGGEKEVPSRGIAIGAALLQFFDLLLPTPMATA